jgi:hypothetical protein
MRRSRFWTLLVLGVAIGVALGYRGNRSTESAQHNSGTRPEFYAWEKTPRGEYKRVKKNYFMDEELCKNVISVLNDMSTTAPRSDWALSRTTSSTFECWSARIDPNDYRKKYSGYSDDPSVGGTSDRK